MGKRLTTDEFVRKAREIHGDKYDYSKVEYVNARSKVIIICDKHGDFQQKAGHHLNGHGCPNCSKTKVSKKLTMSNFEFIEKSNKIHNNFYSYLKTNFKHSNGLLTITCPIHGDFEQRANSHVGGKGCLKCYRESQGFSFSNWCNYCGKNPGIFYVLRCWNDDEEFYKVGITCQGSVEKRYKQKRLMPYNYEIVKEIVDQDRERIWKLEKKYLSLLKDYHYEPKIKFGGSTKECFKI